MKGYNIISIATQETVGYIGEHMIKVILLSDAHGNMDKDRKGPTVFLKERIPYFGVSIDGNRYYLDPVENLSTAWASSSLWKKITKNIEMDKHKKVVHESFEDWTFGEVNWRTGEVKENKIYSVEEMVEILKKYNDLFGDLLKES